MCSSDLEVGQAVGPEVGQKVGQEVGQQEEVGQEVRADSAEPPAASASASKRAKKRGNSDSSDSSFCFDVMLKYVVFVCNRVPDSSGHYEKVQDTREKKGKEDG